MALLRLPPCPSSTQFFSNEHQIFHKAPASSSPLTPFIVNVAIRNTNFFPSCSVSLPVTLRIRPSKTTSHFLLHFSSTTEELVSDTQEEKQEEEYSKTRLLASNVPWTCTPEDVRALFEKFGTVVDVELAMYNKTNNRGLAFVTMGSPEEALAAFTNLDLYEFEGRTLKMLYAKPKKEKPLPPPPPKPGPTFNLFVANLPFQARAKDLREFFIAEGANIVSADIIFHDNPRRSSGYGFVAFKTKKEADAALSTFQGKEFMGRALRMARSRQFVKPQRKEELESNDTSADLKSSEKQADTAD